MTTDFFASAEAGALQRTFTSTFQDWIAARAQASASDRRSSRPFRSQSIAVYEDMWTHFARWCVARERPLASIDPVDLLAFLDQLGGPRAATLPYAKRMLSLIGRVDAFAARVEGRPTNAAIAQVQALPRFRAAGQVDDVLPEFLSAGETRALIALVTEKATRVGQTTRWQDVRDHTAMAVQLGAGLTPGEARRLTLTQIVVAGGRAQGEPWALALPGNGNFPARQTPLARWAGRQLAAWLTIRAAQTIPGDAAFPSTRSGKAWSKASSTVAFQRVLARAGITSPTGGTFKLRHTFALRQLERHAPHEVARWLGVQDPAIMERYRRVLYRPVDVV